MTSPWIDRSLRSLACALPVLLSACGGGGGTGGGTPPPVDCSVAARQDWLRGYMNDWYFWYRLAPNPAPAGFATVEAYFDAGLGVDAAQAERWRARVAALQPASAPKGRR